MRARRRKSPPSSVTPTSMRRSRSAFSTLAPTSTSRSSRPPSGCFERSGKWPAIPAFVAGRDGGRVMPPGGKGIIFFPGATESLRGGSGYAAFASAKFGLRAVAQSMARELGPKNIHVAHLIIDSGVDTAWVRQRREQLWGKETLDNPDLLMPPASVAASYWQLYQQPRSAWTFELEIRPFGEKW